MPTYCPSSGSLSFSTIKSAFSGAGNLSAYRNAAWYTAAGASGNFPAGLIKFSDFYSKGGTPNVVPGSTSITGAGWHGFTVPNFNSITFIIFGGGAGGGGYNGSSLVYNPYWPGNWQPVTVVGAKGTTGGGSGISPAAYNSSFYITAGAGSGYEALGGYNGANGANGYGSDGANAPGGTGNGNGGYGGRSVLTWTKASNGSMAGQTIGVLIGGGGAGGAGGSGSATTGAAGNPGASGFCVISWN